MSKSGEAYTIDIPTSMVSDSYYYKLIIHFYRFHSIAQSRVLHIGSQDGQLLHAVQPCYGVGVEVDTRLRRYAQEHFTQYHFVADIKELTVEQFDYIIISSTSMHTDDVLMMLESIKPFVHTRTRIIADWNSLLYESLTSIKQFFSSSSKKEGKNWFSRHDVHHFFKLAGYDIVTSGKQILIPWYIFGISWACNILLAQIPGISLLCHNQWLIARPRFVQQIPQPTVSIIIPCRNEKGNIEAAVQRTPPMGSAIELIFVEGRSSDGTFDEIERVIKAYPEKNIRVLMQSGKGKGDAVRLGFMHATGDILMILDADITVQPEELPKFYHALVSGAGEFINGSRLVYPMESQATPLLNYFVNHAFGILLSWLLGQRIKDTLCGTKVLYKQEYEKIVRNRSYFGDFDPFGDFDLLFGAAKLNLKIVDMPVHYKNRTYGSSQIGGYFFNGLLLLRMSLIGLRKFKFK